jgi:glycosyltransferase involved in cell wall biosynthesis
MKPFSAVIITYNEEKKIARCLESVAGIADEIVVVDSFSTDKTKQICESFNVRFIEHPFHGYIEKKNYAMSLASHDYVLSLDADEALDDELKQSILQERDKDFPYDCYQMSRMTTFCGQWIKHGTWYPDRKLRLLNHKKGKWGGVNPHDKIVMEGTFTTKNLKGDILHYTYESIEEIILQTNRFTNIQAKAMFDRGRRSNAIKIFINPLMAFISAYFIKLGFLDGYNGFIIARCASYSTLIKYSKLLHMQRQARRNLE